MPFGNEGDSGSEKSSFAGAMDFAMPFKEIFNNLGDFNASHAAMSIPNIGKAMATFDPPGNPFQISGH